MPRWALVFLILAVGAALVAFRKTAAGLVETAARWFAKLIASTPSWKPSW